MASQLEENLCCPICKDIFKEPVLLLCSHSFCKACWEQWWTKKPTRECPVCWKKSPSFDPPRNLNLKNLSEAFTEERDQSRSTDLCKLHSEKLKLFCLDHQQPVCVVCLHSNSHTNHRFSPIDEAAMDYKEGFRELLKPLKEKRELLNDIKGNFDQTAKDIDVQAQDTERQIKDEISMLQKILQKEGQARLAAVREEKKQKSQMIKRKSDALSKELAALSDTVRATELALSAEDLSFLHNYKPAFEKLNGFQLNDPQPIPGGLIDTAKHLNNLPFAIWDSIEKMIPNSRVVHPKTIPELPQRRTAHHSAQFNSPRDGYITSCYITSCGVEDAGSELGCTDHSYWNSNFLLFITT
ncbi:tripartite motif-containing protein 35-like [Sander lucioperca]|uniref:tripartite motif-containing protein 35-like n=1 Tax=Sander lucioperca TaxID=283035 RepID=UPI00125DD2D6|nr:tripartite motif-containing protein 35-like [Sander lucioperca]